MKALKKAWVFLLLVCLAALFSTTALAAAIITIEGQTFENSASGTHTIPGEFRGDSNDNNVDGDVDIVEAALYTKNEDTSSIVETLNYAAGSFSYYSSYTTLDIINWENSDFDKLYGAVTLLSPDATLENVTLTVTLPDGLSFSKELAESEKEINIDELLAGESKQIWFDVPVYLLYSEKYDDSIDSLTLQCEVSGNEIETSKETVNLVGLNIISATDEVTLLRENENEKGYYAWDYAWDTDMFAGNSYTYNKTLAEFSAYMSELIEGSNKDDLQARLESTLLNLGFSKIQYSGYTADTIVKGTEEESVCAIKKIVDSDGNVQTIILYAIQGSDTNPMSKQFWADWIGNCSYSGLQSYHENFEACKENNLKSLQAYCAAVGVEPEDSSVRVLITGHSRGAAIANLVAYGLINDFMESGKYQKNVFCYTFAAPNVAVATDSTDYNCIYNIVNYTDVVPFVPGKNLEQNTLTKYGVTKVFNANDSSAEVAIELLRTLSLKFVQSKQFPWAAKNIKDALSETKNESLLNNHLMSNYIEAVQKDVFSSETFDAFCTDLDAAQAEREIIEKSLWNASIKYTMSNLMSPPNMVPLRWTSAHRAYIVHSVNCPVDVDVLDAFGNVVCRIENDELALYTVDDIGVIINGDAKEIWFEKDSGYHIEISGYGDGKMDYTVTTADNNMEEEAVYIFQDVPVTKGEIVITTEISSNGENVIFTDKAGGIIAPEQTMAGSEITTVTVELSQNRDDVTTTGDGIYTIGCYVLLWASCESDNVVFDGWYDADGNIVSENIVYGFSAYEDISLTAKFSDETDESTPGDLNGDGEVDAGDLTVLARHVGKVETMEDETALANADVTGDGSVDASDLTKLAQYVGKIISSLD